VSTFRAVARGPVVFGRGFAKRGKKKEKKKKGEGRPRPLEPFQSNQTLHSPNDTRREKEKVLSIAIVGEVPPLRSPFARQRGRGEGECGSCYPRAHRSRFIIFRGQQGGGKKEGGKRLATICAPTVFLVLRLGGERRGLLQLIRLDNTGGHDRIGCFTPKKRKKWPEADAYPTKRDGT